MAHTKRKIAVTQTISRTPEVASRGATTSIGNADVRTLVQTIASRIEKLRFAIIRPTQERQTNIKQLASEV